MGKIKVAESCECYGWEMGFITSASPFWPKQYTKKNQQGVWEKKIYKEKTKIKGLDLKW